MEKHELENVGNPIISGGALYHPHARYKVLSFPQFEQMITERLDTFGSVSIQAPLLDYYISEHMEVLRIEKTKEGIFTYHIPESSEIEAFIQDLQARTDVRDKKLVPFKMRIKIENWIRDAILRCGLHQHDNLDNEVMRFIRNYDDIILAPDTNILLDCLFTSILLPKIAKEIDEEPEGCPNWILIAIPKLVMYEIERKAVRKFTYKEFPERVGWPKYDSRIGQRALQEILVLDTGTSYRGLSIMTIGEIPSTYDSFKNDPTRWDSEIRVQTRKFISNMNFHKGTFFLTQDRLNAMMAKAEGLHALFLQKPLYEELNDKEIKTKNVGRLLYEIIITFGEVEIKNVARLSVFWPEKHVTDWEKSRVAVKRVKDVGFK